MPKPNTLHDLLIDGQVSLHDIENIARTVFDGKTRNTGALAPEGYVLTACSYDDLPKHIQDFVRKAFSYFTVENVFDAGTDDDEPEDEFIPKPGNVIGSEEG